MTFDPFDVPPGLSLSGYRVEKPLVADSNATSTMPPNSLVGVGTNTPTEWEPGGIFDADDNSRDRRKEYLIRSSLNEVVSLGGGFGGGGFVVDIGQDYIENILYQWTTNEGSGVSRQEYFGFDAGLRRWELLSGRGPIDAGVVGTGTAYLLPVPIEELFSLPSYREPVPFSVSIGSPSSLLGTQLTVVMVDSFGSPAAGTVECDRTTGELNFSATELASDPNSPVFYQRQRYYPRDEVQEGLGSISNDPILALSPIPPTGSFPRIRVGFREEYLVPLEEATEPLTPPAEGAVAWAADTGVLLFNATDLVTYDGEEIYYDGVILEKNLTLSVSSFGTLGAPSSFGGPPSAGGDHVFTFEDGGGVTRAFLTVLKKYESQVSSPGGPFLESDVLDDPSSIPINEIQVAADTGAVAVSAAAVAAYGAATALSVVDPDLSISHGGTDHGWALRMFPTLLNPERSQDTPRDVLRRTSLTDEVVSSSLGLGDFVFLPGTPIHDTLTVEVQQNTGSFIGDLPSFDSVAPSYTGLVHVLDAPTRTLRFGERKVLTGQTVQADRLITLPDRPLVPGSVELELDASPIVDGDDAIIDLTSGQVTLIQRFGKTLATGFRGATITTGIFRDTTKDFVAAGVADGDRLIIQSGPSPLQGSYPIVGVTSTDLTVDTTSQRATPFSSTGDTNLVYEVHSAPDVIADNTFESVVPQLPKIEVYKIPTSGPDVLLTLGEDYVIAPAFGTIQLTEPLLEGEKLRAVYNQEVDGEAGTAYNEVLGVRVQETLGSYSTLSSSFTFNSGGLTVISSLGAELDVQGRPCRTEAFSVDFGTMVVSITAPTESILKHPNEQKLTAGPSRLTYYVEEAAGGETVFEVLNPPIYSPPYLVEAEATSLLVDGDQTSTFGVGRIVRVNKELAEIASSSYDAGADQTTVELSGQLAVFQRNPPMWVSSYVPDFTALGAFDDVEVGSLLVRFAGDVTGSVGIGTLLKFGDQVHQVVESTFNGSKTVVRLRTTVRELMTSGTHAASSSSLPIFDVDMEVFSPSLPVLLDPSYPVSLYRRLPPSPGVALERDVDFFVSSGVVTLVTGLQVGEVLELEYTGLNPQGGSLDATYTTYIAPNDDNGLLRQRLVVSMDLKTPDTWFVRVEPVAQFVSETIGDLQERGLTLLPSSGTVVVAGGSLANFEQGRRSLIYERGKIVDEDFVARRMLRYTDTLSRSLEGFLRWLIGLVPGDVVVDDPTAVSARMEGPFRFFLQEVDESLDGWVHPYEPFDASRYSAASDPARLNDIDDIIKVDDAPYTFIGSGSPLSVFSIGTYKSAWERSAFSRFFPQQRTVFTRTFDGGGTLGSTLAVVPVPEKLSQAKLLTYRSSTIAEMNTVPIRYLYDLGLAESDQLQELPVVSSRSVLFQVVDPEPDPDTNEVLVDLRALGDVDTSPLWVMIPSLYRPNIDDFDSIQGLHCDVYRRGVAAPIHVDITVSFVSATASSVTVVTSSKLSDLNRGDTFWVSLTGTPPVVYSDGLSYSLDRSAKRLLDNSAVAAGPPLPPSGGSGSPIEVDGTMKLVKASSRPSRIPALFGLPYSDSWDQIPPLLTPLSDPEPQLLQDELTAVSALRDDTTRGFSGTDGGILTGRVFVAGTVPPDEADGEDFTDAPGFDDFDALVIVDDPTTPANEGHFLIESALTTSSSLAVKTLAWEDPAGLDFTAVIRRSTGDTLPASVPPNQLEDLSADFVTLFSGVPGSPLTGVSVIIPGEANSPFGVLSVVDATHLELDAAVTGGTGLTYDITFTASGASIDPDLVTFPSAPVATYPDLSDVATIGDPVVTTGSSPRNAGTFQPLGSTATDIVIGPWVSGSTGVRWYAKRGRAVHSSSSGEIISSTTFRDEVASGISGTLTNPSFSVSVGVLGDSQVGDVVIFSGAERALITSITAGPTLGLSFTTSPPADGPNSITIFRNFELDLVGSTHPSRAFAARGDVLVLTDQTQNDFGRYIISGITEEILTVTRESDLVSGFYTFPVSGLDFKIDDCRRDELNQADSLVGRWGAALGGVKDVYSDISVIPEIGFSLLNHLDNADQFIDSLIDLSSPLVEDLSAALTNATTVTGSIDFTVAGVQPGDILFAIPGDPSDINHGFYIVDVVSPSTLTVNVGEGPDFYVSNAVAAKTPSFVSTPVSPVTVRVFSKPSLISAFALLCVLQEKVQGTEMLTQITDLEDRAIHQPLVEVSDGDPSDTRLTARIGPDVTTQYIANLTDRLDRVRDTSAVLYEDLYSILYTIDALYNQRYGWVSLRLDNVDGTLPRVRRFDETVAERKAELLEALLMTEGGG